MMWFQEPVATMDLKSMRPVRLAERPGPPEKAVARPANFPSGLPWAAVAATPDLAGKRVELRKDGEVLSEGVLNSDQSSRRVIELHRLVEASQLEGAILELFELTLDGDLAYSKLETDQFPDEGEMVSLVGKRLG